MRQRWVLSGLAMAICAFSMSGNAWAQSDEDEPVRVAAIPPLPAPGAGPSEYPVIPDVGLPEYQGRFLSPKCEPGRCRSCEQASGCCCMKSIWHLLPCSCMRKSEGCACPPHFFCPRGHCRVRPTECVRIDYQPYKTVMEPEKLSAAEVADYTRHKASQPVAADLYPVFEPCCQDFWLKDDLYYMDSCSTCYE